MRCLIEFHSRSCYRLAHRYYFVKSVQPLIILHTNLTPYFSIAFNQYTHSHRLEAPTFAQFKMINPQEMKVENTNSKCEYEQGLTATAGNLTIYHFAGIAPLVPTRACIWLMIFLVSCVDYLVRVNLSVSILGMIASSNTTEVLPDVSELVKSNFTAISGIMFSSMGHDMNGRVHSKISSLLECSTEALLRKS